MKIYKILSALLLVSSLNAQYKVNDKISEDIVNKLQLQKDKVYVLDFFASWCISCKLELPLISKLNNTLDNTKYKIIGINVDENKDDGKNFVNDLKLNFEVIYDNNNQIISKFEPVGVPAIYYIKNNTIKKVIFGAVHNIDDQISNDLKNIGE
jgi:thiol-disulfide isomerase/thioredoxin